MRVCVWMDGVCFDVMICLYVCVGVGQAGRQAGREKPQHSLPSSPLSASKCMSDRVKHANKFTVNAVV